MIVQNIKGSEYNTIIWERFLTYKGFLVILLLRLSAIKSFPLSSSLCPTSQSFQFMCLVFFLFSNGLFLFLLHSLLLLFRLSSLLPFLISFSFLLILDLFTLSRVRFLQFFFFSSHPFMLHFFHFLFDFRSVKNLTKSQAFRVAMLLSVV